MIVQELFTPQLLTANSTTALFSGVGGFGGFICSASGNIEVKDGSNNDIIAAMPIVAGGQIWPGMSCLNGLTIVLSGGAAGTALISAQG